MTIAKSVLLFLPPRVASADASTRRGWLGHEEGPDARQCHAQFHSKHLPSRLVDRDHRCVTLPIQATRADADSVTRLGCHEIVLRFLGVRREPYEHCLASDSLAFARVIASLWVLQSHELELLLVELPRHVVSLTGELRYGT